MPRPFNHELHAAPRRDSVPNTQKEWDSEFEEVCMERVRRGDRAAFRELYEGTSGTVFALLVRLVNSRAMAEELLVDAYAQAWELRERFDPLRGSALAWLVMLARSRALDRLRAESRDRIVFPGDARWFDGLLAPGDPALDELEHREERDHVESALVDLPLDQSRLLRAAFFVGLSHTEIAAAEELPLGTVKSRIRAGLAHLRTRLVGLANDLPSVRTPPG